MDKDQYQHLWELAEETIAAKDAEIAALQELLTEYCDNEPEAKALVADAQAAEIAALREASHRYLAAVKALGRASGFNGLTFFEAPILPPMPKDLGLEAIRRWQELDSAGKALRAALEMNGEKSTKRKDTIAAKDAEIAALREALKPFGDAARGVPEYTKEIRWVRGDLLEACRRARASLEMSGGVK